MKPAIRYRLYTEDLNRDNIMDLLNDHFEGYTLIPNNIGVWQTHVEKSLVIEIVTDDNHEESIRSIARDIVHVNRQQAVLVTKEYIWSEEVLIF